MPRYFFDFADANDVYPDDQGTDLPDVEAAKVEAAKALAAIVKDKADGSDRSFAMIVRTETGEVLLHARIKFEIEMAH
ncbi:MAG: hypothetical protein E5W81_26665 [Mesorhizobium sp.]|uniref:DUF6894 family protein n=1 Tax=unclassified Mesorhizobium TaxID=325217 RepID=UPI0012214083|nr:hypothetical protein [Mesorhizobium sp.]TIT17708.1 MAG: hypothetical protein E5W70_31570 [Mesorhizobium sp.]TKB41414.1 MAG: hypothetical protein E5W81_26665 [Mesorhizobium sp.]